jgi:deoxyribonuclease V
MPLHLRQLHSWDLTPADAVALQRQLAGQVDTTSPLKRAELIAGADVSYNRFSNTLYAAVVLWRRSDGAILETAEAVGETHFPYIPGLLSFREAPSVLAALGRLQGVPDLVMLDGQGVAHPRRLGLACHVGLWLDCPTLGCAKSRLIGQYREPGSTAGCATALKDKDSVIGKVVRTKTGIKPVFVSPGNRLNLVSAVRCVLACCRGYRLPEPTRQAHLHVNALRRQAPANQFPC